MITYPFGPFFSVAPYSVEKFLKGVLLSFAAINRLQTSYDDRRGQLSGFRAGGFEASCFSNTLLNILTGKRSNQEDC